MKERDTGLEAVAIIARHFNIPAEVSQLERSYVLEKGAVSSDILLRAGQELHMKSRKLENITVDKLENLPLPLIMKMNGGNYIVLLGPAAKLVENNEAAGAEHQDDWVIYDTRVSNSPQRADRNKVLDDWSGEALLFTRRHELQREQESFGYKWFVPIIYKYRQQLFKVLLVSVVLQLLGLAGPFFTQTIIDKVLIHRSLDTFDVLVVGMFMSTMFQQWITAMRGYIFTHITSEIDATLGGRLFKVISFLPLSFFDKWKDGEVVSRVGELENLRNFLTGSSLTAILDIIFSIIYFAVMLYYSPVLTLIVSVVLVCFVILNVVVAPIYRNMINRRFLINAECQSFLIESINGMHTIKMMAVESEFVRRYEDIFAHYLHTALSVINLANIVGSISMFLQQIFNLSILWIGAIYAMDGDITVGELIAFQMIAGMLIAPVMRLVDAWQYFQQTHVSINRLADVMNETCEPEFNPSRTTLPKVKGTIEFDDVSFSYDKKMSSVLNNINISIPAGTRVGIVGASGSGKSTFTKLIQRLYTPEIGRILIDGVDIAQVEPAWLRRNIGVVMQENMLFSGTIEENIKIAFPNATHEDVERAAYIAGAHEFIERLPNKYNTFVGEGGGLLSGGQKQRIAIARALISDPHILIFDEATSALDYESEAHIMSNMGKIAQGRTALIIAHRLSTVRVCDAIIVIENGKIVEGGPHDELMRHQGAYYRLYMQGIA